jgi:hypothetical protein
MVAFAVFQPSKEGEEVKQSVVVWLVLFLMLSMAAQAVEKKEGSMELVIKAGESAFAGGPVRFAVQGELAKSAILELKGKDGKSSGFAQKDGEEFVTLLPAMKAAEEASFTASAVKNAPTRVQLDRADSHIDVVIDGKLFTAYHFEPDNPKPFLFPVQIGDNLRLTRSYPMEDLPEEEGAKDHHHHVSWWVAFGEVNDGNFWMADEGHDWQRPREILEVTSGPVFGRIRALNDWNMSDGKPVVQEEREYVFYAGSGPDRTTDMQVTFNAVHGDVKFSDTKEGGICSFRMHPALDEQHGNGQMKNSEGKAGESECWGKPANWCDYSGNLKGQNVGIAVMDHASNLRHPSRWHIRAYGLYSANVFGLEAFGEAGNGDYTIPKDKTLTFNYRVLVHLGNTEEAQVAERYSGYTAPPAVTVR